MTFEKILLLIGTVAILGLFYRAWITARKLKDVRGFECKLLLYYLRRALNNGLVGDVVRFSSGANGKILNFSIYGDKNFKGMDWVIPINYISRDTEEKIIEFAQKHKVLVVIEDLAECKAAFVDLSDLSGISPGVIMELLDFLGVQNTKIAIEDVDFVVPSRTLKLHEVNLSSQRTTFPERRDLERLFSSDHRFLSSSALPLVDCSLEQRL